MGFTANYQTPNRAVVGPYLPTQITSVSNQATTAIASNYSQEYFGRPVVTATAATPARAEYRVNWSGVFGAQTVRLNFYVNSSGVASSTIVNG